MSSSNSHSPSASPTHTLMSNPSGAAYGAGMGANPGLKTLNAGWQVWGGATAAPKRNVSGPSSTGASDSLAESWPQSRSTSGSWTEDSRHSPRGTQRDTHSSLYNHQRRQQPATAKGRALSPQRSPGHYEGLGFDQSRSTSLASPNKPGGYGGPTFPAPDTASSVDELTSAMRGMAVEDDSSYRHTQQPHKSGGQPPRHPPASQRLAYGTYPAPEYSSYYPAQSGQVEYGYGYPTDPSLYITSPVLQSSPAVGYPTAGSPPMHMGDPRQQANVYYDYPGAARMGSPYYYHAQAVVYHPSAPSPLVAHQAAGSAPATLSDKKREMQYTLLQNQTMGGQAVVYPSIGATASRPYSEVYGSPMPVMVPGGSAYGHATINASPMQRYQPNLRQTSGRRGSVDPAAGTRSPLLEEFRANKTRKWELSEIFGYVAEFSGDQHGSRFIQQQLKTATSEERQRVFDELVPLHALQLTQDVFGNYVVQMLFEGGTPSQQAILARVLEKHHLSLSLQMYGCRVVQKAVEFVSEEQQAAIVQELEPHVMRCVMDANGNHVIQKLIECVTPHRLLFVNNFKGNVYELSTHPYGCRVLQRCFERLPEEQTRPLLDELHKYTLNLMQDQFGNYVVQFVLEHGSPADRELVVAKLHGQMLNMARHKFASNVCEKALMTASRENRVKLIDEILQPKQDGIAPVITMMKDQFANYVLQRALAVVDGEQKEVMLAKIRPQLVSMRRYSSPYSKHLLAIERLIEKLDKSEPVTGKHSAVDSSRP